MAKSQVTYPEFTGPEAAELVETTQDRIRLWRSRGYLLKGSGEGHPRLTLMQLCLLYALARLSDQGIDPKDGLRAAYEASKLIFDHAIKADCYARNVPYLPGDMPRFLILFGHENTFCRPAKSLDDVQRFFDRVGNQAVIWLTLDCRTAGEIIARGADRPLIIEEPEPKLKRRGRKRS
jgi:hypothetical protein